jgi:hypothetical protein
VQEAKASAEPVVLFESVERRFGAQAWVAMAVAGLTGFYMIIRLDLWGRFLSAAYWWMDTRVALWLLFTLMLFVAELLVLDR